MTLSEFLNAIYINSGSDLGRYDFFLELTNNAMREPASPAEKESYKNDEYNPFSKLAVDTIERYFSSGKVNVKLIRIIYERRDPHKLAKFIKNFGPNACFDMEEDIKKRLPGFNSEEDVTEYAIADAFFDVINNYISGKQEVQSVYTDPTERLATAVALGPDFYVDIRANTLHIGKKIIQLPEKLLPPEIPSSDEDIYVKAILAAYADDLGRPSLEIAELQSLEKKYQKHFSTQRISYYCALRICRILRESFIDAEDELDLWKTETRDYIFETLNKDYESAYKRLVAVLEFVVDCTTTAAVDSCKRLIGPNEKKGVCHILANEGTITWVDEDE